MNLRKTSK